MLAANKEISISGKFIRIATLKEEWYEDVGDPEAIIADLKKARHCPDLFTFWQRLPETSPKFKYFMEWDNIAALPIKSYEFWWTQQIKDKTRNLVRKAEKKGVIIKKTDFDDAFVQGMTAIFNETPVRQGKKFWHFGKTFETIKTEFSRFLFREELYGAYLGDELIGFIFLANAGKYGVLGQILSKIEHRDKSPQNALIAKAVEVCEKKSLPYLIYAKWPQGSLAEFKKNNGFEKIGLPRYYVPLTLMGKIILKFKLHQGVKGLLKEEWVEKLKAIRNSWYKRHS
jgi:hypothetical protein